MTNDARELIAQQIEKEAREQLVFLAGDESKLGRYRLIGAEDAYKDAIRIVRGAAGVPEQARQPELEQMIEYGHQTVALGWIVEPRGIKYATHQRTVHFSVDDPIRIDHWSDPDNRKPFPPVVPPTPETQQ